MTLRQYYRAALLFPLIPPIVSGTLVSFRGIPGFGSAAGWAELILIVSCFGLVPYVPTAIAFFLWERQHAVAPRNYGRVLLSFPLAAAVVGFLISFAMGVWDGSISQAVREGSSFAVMTIAGGYLYVAIIAAIAAICRRDGYITPESSSEQDAAITVQ